MKLMKITVQKSKELENNNYTLFRLESINKENAQILGNTIRRALIKETERLIFIINKKK